MNADTLKGNWKIIKGKVKEAWGDLTDDEITRVEGNYDALVGTVQKKYGQTKEQTEQKVNEFLKSVNGKNEEPTV